MTCRRNCGVDISLLPMGEAGEEGAKIEAGASPLPYPEVLSLD
jgi:hypothetical protein